MNKQPSALIHEIQGQPVSLGHPAMVMMPPRGLTNAIATAIVVAYFHDGSAATLSDVVKTYNTEQGLGLTNQEIATWPSI